MVTDKTRRRLLKAALFGSTFPISRFGFSADTPTTPALIGCAIKGRDSYAVVVADEFGNPLSSLPLPARGHGVATHEHGHAVAFGRRPGSYFMVFDYRKDEIIQVKLATGDRHFYGHGVYSKDGQYLFVTEGERSTSRGIIGVYDVAKGYQKLDELTGFGIGPHEVIMLPDGVLAIGVGGVHTDGRQPLNLGSMTPSLSYLTQEGRLLERATLTDKKLSIRHLATDSSGTVFCGQQYRGEPDEYPALIAMHARGGELTSLNAEPEQWARFNHYIASIATTDDWLLATSPPGNCYGIWSRKTGELVEINTLPDASGVVTYGDEFRISSGAGTIVQQRPPHKSKSITHSIQWDNHWSRIN